LRIGAASERQRLTSTGRPCFFSKSLKDLVRKLLEVHHAVAN
jgi:hypothetical protein